MKKVFTLTVLSVLTTVVFAQTNNEFEGVNLAVGFASNATTASASTGTPASASTAVSIAKINYTFPLVYPAKLGFSASFDLKNSRIADNESLAITTPTELSVEPGFLLYTGSLVYAKLGTYSSSYESTVSLRKVTGTHIGLGLKHYVYDSVFLQGEITERKAEGGSGTWDNFKQRSTALLVGYTF